jgi:hypothetical protein
MDLQKLLDEVYETGRYESIDYGQRCEPPLEGADAVWAEEILKAAGRR